jgi:hypothetical protein
VELLIGAAVILFGLWVLAPRLAGAEPDPRAKGLSALQSLCALAGIVLVAEWYFVEQPDAARLKFDQAVAGAPLADGRALVTTEVSIANVGGHASHFDHLPYKVFVQAVAPDPDNLPPDAAALEPNGAGRVWRADNWPALAYRAVGKEGASKAYPNWDRGYLGLKTTIQPNEVENLYFAAAIPCEPNLRVAVSSRFRRPRTFLDTVLLKEPEWWIKQTFLDLTEACKAAKPAPPPMVLGIAPPK